VTIIIIVTHIGRPLCAIANLARYCPYNCTNGYVPSKGYILSDMDFALPSFPVWTACGRNSISQVVASCCGCWSHVVLVVCFANSERSNARGSSGEGSLTRYDPLMSAL
jgi:hypothetical protein